MENRKLLNEWYGYDKSIKAKLTGYNGDDLNFPYNRYNPTYDFRLTSAIATHIRRNCDSEYRMETARHYFVETDGLTQDDYLAWSKAHNASITIGKCQGYNWRVLETLSKNPDFASEFFLKSILNDFFSLKPKRNDRIIRSIELNEFVHRATDDQTFEDFLLTDTEYEENCKNLILKNYSTITKDIVDNFAPKFLQFGSKVNSKTRSLLLPLTRTKMENVLDFKSNPYYDQSRKDSYTFEYTELFISSALNGIKRVMFNELSPLDITNQIYLRVMSAPKAYWENALNRKSLSSILDLIQIEIKKCTFSTASFKRNFSHLVSTGALDNITPAELIAVVSAYEKSHRWAESTKGKSTLDIVTELIDTKKIDAEFIAKLMAHIIINDLQPIVVELDFDWSTVNNMPVEWAYEAVPQSTTKKRLLQPVIFKSFS